jgi:hypothetical protein
LYSQLDSAPIKRGMSIRLQFTISLFHKKLAIFANTPI